MYLSLKYTGSGAKYKGLLVTKESALFQKRALDTHCCSRNTEAVTSRRLVKVAPKLACSHTVLAYGGGKCTVCSHIYVKVGICPRDYVFNKRGYVFNKSSLVST